MILSHINAAGWPFPAGWLYRNVVGNWAADLGGVVAAYFVGVRRGIKKFHAKLDSLHEKQDRLHAHLGVPQPEDL